jgi:hypothetical protein
MPVFPPGTRAKAHLASQPRTLGLGRFLAGRCVADVFLPVASGHVETFCMCAEFMHPRSNWNGRLKQQVHMTTRVAFTSSLFLAAMLLLPSSMAS